VIFVPFFTIVFPLLGHRIEPVQAVEVGLLTEIFGFMSSTSAFWRAGLIDFKISGFALMFAVPTAVLGGYSAHLLPGHWLLVMVGVALILFAFLLIRETAGSSAAGRTGPTAAPRRRSTPTAGDESIAITGRMTFGARARPPSAACFRDWSDSRRAR
jgi:uncharacterized membrane protein YfcA